MVSDEEATDAWNGVVEADDGVVVDGGGCRMRWLHWQQPRPRLRRRTSSCWNPRRSWTKSPVNS